MAGILQCFAAITTGTDTKPPLENTTSGFNFFRRRTDWKYPFMTLNDDTEIVHSEMKPDGRVKVYIERPDEKYGFRHATCWLPDYTWEDIYQFSDEEINRLQKIIESTTHLIMEFSQEGGFENASGF